MTAVALMAAWLWGLSPSSAASGSMSLRAAGSGVVCDDPLHPTACSVPQGGVFTLSIAIDSLPDASYGGIQTQVVYRPLTYQPAATADDEIVWPDASAEPGFQDRQPSAPTGLEGSIAHTAATGLNTDLTLPPSSYVGEIVRIALRCPQTVKAYRIALPAYTATNDLGAAFISTDFNFISPNTVAQEAVDLNGDTILETVPVADVLRVTCGQLTPPTPMPNSTKPPADNSGSTPNPTSVPVVGSTPVPTSPAAPQALAPTATPAGVPPADGSGPATPANPPAPTEAPAGAPAGGSPSGPTSPSGPQAPIATEAPASAPAGNGAPGSASAPSPQPSTPAASRTASPSGTRAGNDAPEQASASPGDNGDSSGLSAGAWAGIAVAGTAGTVLLGGAAWTVRRRRMR